MPTAQTDDQRSLTRDSFVAALAMGAWGALLGIAALFPNQRLWGVNYLAFAGPEVRWGFALAFLGLLVYVIRPTLFADAIRRVPSRWK